MSVVSRILSGLEYLRRIRWRIPSVECGLARPSRPVPCMGLGGRHEDFSPSYGNEFNREELARRAINESLARMPIAR
jgi:hypothetical protein